MLSAIILSVTLLRAEMLCVIMLNVIMLSVILLSGIMLSVTMLSVIMLSVIVLNLIMLSVIMLTVIKEIVVAPKWQALDKKCRMSMEDWNKNCWSFRIIIAFEIQYSRDDFTKLFTTVNNAVIYFYNLACNPLIKLVKWVGSQCHLYRAMIFQKINKLFVMLFNYANAIDFSKPSILKSLAF